MATRGVAILPTGMSRERFEWLDRWCENPAEDVIRTVGTESNVKEIYDECNRLALDPQNFVFNQFAEFGNHLVHYAVTGPALAHVFESYRQQVGRDVRLALMTSATGSAGTIAAGEYLKDTHGTKVLAAEALECPTLLENGFGEHNIQGIGDKHVPLIHNVMRHDLVAAVSDRATDHLEVMFDEPEGLALLAGRGVPAAVLDALADFGFSSICNVLAAISAAKVLGLGPDDVVVTVATDGGQLYRSERAKVLERDFGGEFTRLDAAAVWGEHLANVPHRRDPRAHRTRPQPHLQPGLLHLGRAAGHPVRAVRAPARAGLLARAAVLPPAVGRADHRVQRPGGRVVTITRFRRRTDRRGSPSRYEEPGRR